MSFSTEILKPDSERFVLVRVKPRKYLGLGTLVSGNTYSFPFEFSEYGSVFVDGTEITSGNLSLSNGLLYITNSNNLTLSTFTCTAEIPIYMTGMKARYTFGNTADLPEAVWEPYIKSYPRWAQTVKNIGEAVFSIENTSIEVISEDRWIQNIAGDNFSWSRADVDVWVCVDTVENCKKIFTGEVISLSISGETATISVADIFNRLTKKSEFGESNQAYFSSTLPEYVGKPIPLVIGVSSPCEIASGYRPTEAFGTPAATSFYHQTKGLPCVPVSGNLDTSTSVDFLVGRIIGTTLATLNFGTISYAYEHWMTKTVYADNVQVPIGVRLLYLSCSNVSGLRIGDYVPGQGNICSVSNFNHAGLNYNVAIVKTGYFFDGAATYTSGVIAVPSIANNTYPSMSVWIDGDGPASYEISSVTLGLVPLWAIPSYSGRYVPFTVSYSSSYDPGIGKNVTHVYATVTSSGISHSSKPELPGKQRMFCRFSPATPLTHAEALEITCRRAGLEINSASFSTADTDLVADVSMTIPSLNQNEWPTLLQVAQSIIKSTFGVLKVNTDREVEYHILKDPDSLTSIATKDDSNILLSSFSTNIEYQDSVYQAVFENPEFKDLESLTSTGPYSLETSNLARYLHKTDKTTVFQHVLASIANIKDRIFEYLTNPSVEYSFETASEDLDSTIGDVVTMENDAVASNIDQINGMIVGVESTPTRTRIRTNELRGVT